MHKYEIEIKSLLGGKEKADELKTKMAKDPSFSSLGSHKQLNHYFEGGNLNLLFEKTNNFLSQEQQNKLKDLSTRAKDFSVRTRWADGKVILVVKASVDDTTSSNGTARLEFESELKDISDLDKLDELVLSAGFHYQAKWSREREDFTYKGANVSVDKNAGYGYLSEFEMVVDDPKEADKTKSLLRQMMADLNITELPQDRLARMFEFYNKNWKDYYGTENIFNIE